MSKTLVEYIRLALREAALARVPQQLVTTEEDDGKEGTEGTEGDVNEFSGAGAVAGFTGPLGMSPDELGRKKNR